MRACQRRGHTCREAAGLVPWLRRQAEYTAGQSPAAARASPPQQGWGVQGRCALPGGVKVRQQPGRAAAWVGKAITGAQLPAVQVILVYVASSWAARPL
jgi:hypothetical protein